jgi:hypothetical protein
MNHIEHALVISQDGRSAFESFCGDHSVTVVVDAGQLQVPKDAWVKFLREEAAPRNKKLLTLLEGAFPEGSCRPPIVNQLREYTLRFDDLFNAWDQGLCENLFHGGMNFPSELNAWLERLLEEDYAL